MNATRELAPEVWGEYLDAVGRELDGAEISIEIEAADRPPQREVTSLALQAITYDQRDDVFVVSAARGGPRLPSVLRHLVDHPERIIVDSHTLLAPMMIAVDGGDGVRTEIRIQRPPEFGG